MLKVKYSLALTVICSTLTSFPKSSQAQDIFVPGAPEFPDMCGYREAPCRRDSDGNIVDRETGDLYDKKGHLIRRNSYPPEQSTEESSSDQLQYGAISRSRSTGRYAWVSGYDDYEAAENAADQECGVSDCISGLFGNAFGAIAKTSGSASLYFEKADTPEQAAREVLDNCQDYSEISDESPENCEVLLVVGAEEGTIFQK